jgi:hypothetical protein
MPSPSSSVFLALCSSQETKGAPPLSESATGSKAQYSKRAGIQDDYSPPSTSILTKPKAVTSTRTESSRRRSGELPIKSSTAGSVSLGVGSSFPAGDRNIHDGKDPHRSHDRFQASPTSCHVHHEQDGQSDERAGRAAGGASRSWFSTRLTRLGEGILALSENECLRCSIALGVHAA